MMFAKHSLQSFPYLPRLCMMCALRLAKQLMVNSNGDQALKSTHKVTIKSENETRNRMIKLSISELTTWQSC